MSDLRCKPETDELKHFDATEIKLKHELKQMRDENETLKSSQLQTEAENKSLRIEVMSLKKEVTRLQTERMLSFQKTFEKMPGDGIDISKHLEDQSVS